MEQKHASASPLPLLLTINGFGILDIYTMEDWKMTYMNFLKTKFLVGEDLIVPSLSNT